MKQVLYIKCKKDSTTSASLLVCALLLFLSAGCSTTKHLPEDELLYKGIEKTIIVNRDKSDVGEFAVGEVEGALAFKPNNSFFGSSSTTWWPPMGLWIYNGFNKYNSGVGKWIFDKLAAKPVFISTVNPTLRATVAQNLLRDYGYFNATVGYSIDTLKAGRKAKIIYKVDMQKPFMLDSVMYVDFQLHADTLIRAQWDERLLRSGRNFSVVSLDNERQRLASLFRNNGYFYYRPEYITFQADTLMRPGTAALKVMPQVGLPAQVEKQWRLGPTSLYLTGYNGEQPTDSMLYKGMWIHYAGKRPGIRPSVIYNRLRYKEGDFYSQQRQLQSQEALNRLGIFRYSEFQYLRKDTTDRAETLDVRLNAAFDLPLDGELEVNFTSKSNDMIGPGAIFGVTRRNVFRGGETFGVKLKASYEWQTNSSVEGKKAETNSYEFGISSSLEFPWLVLPKLHKRYINYPASTTFRLSADLLNRGGLFRIYSFGGNATYSFQPGLRHVHTLTPLRLTYNMLRSTSTFDDIMDKNPGLYLSMQSQFIPALSYTYTYNTNKDTSVRNHLWWETSFTSAGNLLSAAKAIGGQDFHQKGKTLFGNPFAQFLKLTSEVRYNIKIDNNQSIATRFMAGAIYAYGNSTMAPYSEQFFIGGANSVRAFTVRSIGPGRYRPNDGIPYSYIYQTGDVKMEANVEYRFRLVGDLKGAIFLDAGNVWAVRDDENRPGATFKLSQVAKEIALGTGAGLRYDLTFLVVRFDVGVGLHAPYDTGKSSYYNIPRFKDSLSYHLAIGYPF